MKNLLTFFHIFFAVLLAVAGAWLLLDPISFLGTLHAGGTFLDGSVLLGRQTGLGLLLAAGINLFCALRADARAVLHPLVLLYLLGLVLTHRLGMSGMALWLWLLVILYALPLFALAPVKLPRPGVTLAPGEEYGEVKWFNPTKGFGFLVADDGREVFVHFRAVQNGGRRSLKQGQRVRFTTRQSERGEQADKVHIENN